MPSEDSDQLGLVTIYDLCKKGYFRGRLLYDTSPVIRIEYQSMGDGLNQDMTSVRHVHHRFEGGQLIIDLRYHVSYVRLEKNRALIFHVDDQEPARSVAHLMILFNYCPTAEFLFQRQLAYHPKMSVVGRPEFEKLVPELVWDLFHELHYVQANTPPLFYVNFNNWPDQTNGLAFTSGSGVLSDRPREWSIVATDIRDTHARLVTSLKIKVLIHQTQRKLAPEYQLPFNPDRVDLSSKLHRRHLQLVMELCNRLRLKYGNPKHNEGRVYA